MFIYMANVIIWRYRFVVVVRESPFYLYGKSPSYLYSAIAL